MRTSIFRIEHAYAQYVDKINKTNPFGGGSPDKPHDPRRPKNTSKFRKEQPEFKARERPKTVRDERVMQARFDRLFDRVNDKYH